jgi:hypothetical protein
MYHPIAHVVEVVLFRGGPNVAVVVPVPLETAVDCRDQDIAADVEFPVVDQKAVFDVFLHNETALAAVLSPLKFS